MSWLKRAQIANIQPLLDKVNQGIIDIPTAIPQLQQGTNACEQIVGMIDSRGFLSQLSVELGCQNQVMPDMNMNEEMPNEGTQL